MGASRKSQRQGKAAVGRLGLQEEAKLYFWRTVNIHSPLIYYVVGTTAKRHKYFNIGGVFKSQWKGTKTAHLFSLFASSFKGLLQPKLFFFVGGTAINTAKAFLCVCSLFLNTHLKLLQQDLLEFTLQVSLQIVLLNEERFTLKK